MHVAEFGTGRPIVFIHGWRLDGRVEASDMEPAFVSSEGWKRLYLTLPGMGQSAADPEVRDMNGYLDLILDFIQGVAGGRGFAVAGTSAGAALARAVACTFEKQVRGVLLRVPMLDDRRRPQYANDAERDENLDLPQGESWIPTAYKKQHTAKIERLWRPSRATADANESVVAIRSDQDKYVLRGSYDQMLTIPSLIIAGRQDSRVGFGDALRASVQFPRATVAVLDRDGHALPTNSRVVLDALVQDWLIRMEEVWHE